MRKLFHRSNFSIFLILAAGLILRVVLSFYGTLSLDQNTFIAWGQRLTQIPLSHFYDAWSDYLPGYLYILDLLAQIGKTNAIPTTVLYKLPAIYADVLTGLLIYKIVIRIKSKRWALGSAVLYIFNPAVLGNSTLWGQVDSLTSLFSLFAIYLAGFNPIFSAVSLAVGTLIKPQAALAGIVVLFIAWRGRWRIKNYLVYGATGAAVFILGFVPFSNGSIFNFIFQRISATLSQYPYGSINAFNFWGLFGFWKPDNGLNIVGLVLFFAVVILAGAVLWKKKHSEYLLLSIVFLANFLFFTRMHERHMLPGLAPLAVAVAVSPNLIISYCILSVTYIANLYYSYAWITRDFVEVFSSGITKIFIFGNMAAFGLVFVAEKLGGFFGKAKHEIVEEEKNPILAKKARIWLAVILLFALATRLIGLSRPAGEYFDEVYHAFTARAMLHGDAKAWEWGVTAPEGFAYEWTHPPLAKEGMVAGMLIFGENAFGWRFPGAILGVGSVYLIYLIAKKLFGSEKLALLSAGVMAMDGLALVTSRIGMNDTYFVFFALLSFYMFLKDRNFWAAIFLGCAAASKWSVFWFIPILFATQIILKKKLRISLAWFLVLPIGVYMASYIPFFTTGHRLDQFFSIEPYGLVQQMWWYHTHLKATHVYTSPWWAWPLMLRPIWLYVSSKGDWVANIYAMGNPMVLWGGLAAVAWCGIQSVIKRNKRLMVVVFAYFAFFVPWVASPRIMFLYHYFPSVPFLAIALGYVLWKYQRLILPFFVLAGILFVYFYPHWSGIFVPTQLDNSYYWFTSWR